jgi:hypothetical protein
MPFYPTRWVTVFAMEVYRLPRRPELSTAPARFHGSACRDEDAHAAIHNCPAELIPE